MVDPSSLEVGELVAGKYTVEGVIGSGGMGRVYAAVNELIDQRVAIKVLRSEVSQIEGVTERFIREARASVALSSEHVGRVFDVGMLRADIPFIVMERLTGDNLSQMLHKGPLDLARVATILVQVCDAIEEAHGLGIVHRDIKPANIFVSVRRQGRIHAKILDFGIAKALSETTDMHLTTTGTALGTPQYMSPEQMADSALAGPPTDVWALGVTLYHALTNRYPFESTTPMGLAMKVAREVHTPLEQYAPDLPPAIFRIVDACLRKDPAERITVTELQEALAEFEVATPRQASAFRDSDAAQPTTGSLPRLSFDTGSESDLKTHNMNMEPFEEALLNAPETQLSGASPSHIAPIAPVVKRGLGLQIALLVLVALATLFGGVLFLVASKNSSDGSATTSGALQVPSVATVANAPEQPTPTTIALVPEPSALPPVLTATAASGVVGPKPTAKPGPAYVGGTVKLPVRPTATATGSVRSPRVISTDR